MIEVTRASGNKKIKMDSKVTNSFNVLLKINGENKSVPQGISILKLLEIYKLNKDRVVIELNKKILIKQSYENITLKENDELEIVTFVGGG